MHFLAGILVAWTVVELLIACGSVIACVSFGKTRIYLVYAAFCVFLSIIFLGKAGQCVAVDFRQAAWGVRLFLAALPLSAVTLLYLALYNFDLDKRIKRTIVGTTGLLSIALAGACLAGMCADEVSPELRKVRILWHESVIRGFNLTLEGYAVALICLGLGVAAGILLAKINSRDRVARYFFLLGIGVLTVLGVNDILFTAKLIESAFLVEHGLFLMNLCVLIGFFRMYERSRGELQERTWALERANQRLDSVTDETRRLRPMADLGRLSASLAHEIRNPLAVLNNVASTLQRQGVAQADSERYYSLIKILQEETDRLARLVDDLLVFSHAGRTSKDPVDPVWLVQQAITDGVHQIPPDTGVNIVTEVEPGLPSIPGSADNLRRALLNLVVNAVQSSSRGGQVTVIARLSSDSPQQLVIGVNDEAGGISETEISEIFEPFYSTRSTGTGLGLPIAKSIAEAHSGNLVLENRPGVGASFWLRLPVSPPEHAGPEPDTNYPKKRG